MSKPSMLGQAVQLMMVQRRIGQAPSTQSLKTRIQQKKN